MKLKWLAESTRLFFGCLTSSFYFARGVYALFAMPKPIVTIFGGAHGPEENAFKKTTYNVAAQCVEHGMSVLTGGGPGIMEAANCGAFEYAQKNNLKGKRTLGIGVKDVDPEYKNPCARVLTVNYFFVRNWLLSRYSAGFIVLPGGLGTAYELFDILNLMKVDKLARVPVVLIGKSYWQPLIDWYFLSAFEGGFIKPKYKDLFFVTDDIKEVIDILRSGVHESLK